MTYFPQEFPSLREIVKVLVISHCGIQDTNTLMAWFTLVSKEGSVCLQEVSGLSSLLCAGHNPVAIFCEWVPMVKLRPLYNLWAFLKWKHRQKLELSAHLYLDFFRCPVFLNSVLWVFNLWSVWDLIGEFCFLKILNRWMQKQFKYLTSARNLNSEFCHWERVS